MKFPRVFADGVAILEQSIVEENLFAGRGLDEDIRQIAVVFVGLGGAEHEAAAVGDEGIDEALGTVGIFLAGAFALLLFKVSWRFPDTGL